MGNGTYAEQATWSNDTNRCDISHAIVGGGGGGNTVTVTNPGNQTGTVGTATSLQIHAQRLGDRPDADLQRDRPAGRAVDQLLHGLISGTPTTAGTYSVTVTATDTPAPPARHRSPGRSRTGGGGGCSRARSSSTPASSPARRPGRPTSGVINTDGAHSHAGSGYAWLDGYGTTHTDTLSQSVAIPAGCSATLTFYLRSAPARRPRPLPTTSCRSRSNGTRGHDVLEREQGRRVRRCGRSTCPRYAGQTVTVKWTGTEDSSLATSFFVDDTALTLS